MRGAGDIRVLPMASNTCASGKTLHQVFPKTAGTFARRRGRWVEPTARAVAKGD